MDFGLSEDHILIRDTAREIAEEKIKPYARELDETETVRLETVRELGELGYMSMMIPEEYGGAGLDTISYVLVMEEFSRVCASTGVCVSVNNSLFADGVYKFGTEDQRQRFLPPMGDGRAQACISLSEPGAGTDVGSTLTTATKDGDSWVLNGKKNFATNGGFADFALVLVSTDQQAGHKGLSMFIVDKGTPGFSVGRHELKLGIRGSDTSELLFDDCRVPESSMLGSPGKGLSIALTILNGGRIGIAAQAIGIGQAAYEDAVAYSKERQQFGKPISEFQAVAFKLADMAVELEAAKLLTLKAAWLKDQGQDYITASAKAKLFASEAANRIATEALQIHGGYGYIRDFNVERYFRDARITTIYEGTSEAQRIVISRDVLR
jgi:alkylation response protein AidB-like acyl-CoA dehydrogenase